MTGKLYGERQEMIVKYIEKFKVMTRDQIITLFFSEVAAKVKNCNETMLKLVNRGFLKRIDAYQQYHYTLEGELEVEPRSPKYNHHIDVAELFCSIYKTPDIKVIRFDVDAFMNTVTGIPSPDLIVQIRLPNYKKCTFFFEVQRTSMGDAYYSSKMWKYGQLVNNPVLADYGYDDISKINVFYISDKIDQYNCPDKVSVVAFESISEFIDIYLPGIIRESKRVATKEILDSDKMRTQSKGPEPIQYAEPKEKIPNTNTGSSEKKKGTKINIRDSLKDLPKNGMGFRR